MRKLIRLFLFAVALGTMGVFVPPIALAASSTLEFAFTVPSPAYSFLLPGEFGVWQASAPARSIKVEDLGDNWATGTPGARMLQEAGAGKIAEERTYQNGSDTITIRAYKLRDPSSAFELYTYLLTPGMKDLGIGENSAGAASDERFLIGNVVVVAALPATAKPDVLNDLLSALKGKVDHTPLPPMRAYLPTKWRVNGSEKYALGPEAFRSALNALDQAAYSDLTRVAGFESGAEAMLARFESGHNSGVLVLLEYPTPQLAEQHLHHLEAALSSDAKRAGVKVERKASLLSVVLAPDSTEFANNLRQAVNYDTEVTWNEGSHVATDPPILVMVVKIFMYTGLFMVVTVGLGLIFGAVRVFVKRYFPGKVFDKPEDIEIIQLGLSGKKIDSSDMY
jgi:hypothetical protein